MADTNSWNNIYLSGRAAVANVGQLRVSANGFSWRKSGGGRDVDVSKNDIGQLYWMKIPGGCQLAIAQKSGNRAKFHGFRDSDLATLREFASTHYGVEVTTREMAVSGRTWGEAEVVGSTLSFQTGGKTAFEVDCADITGVTQQSKTDVMIEFGLDDTAGAFEKDALLEMSFHVPVTNKTHEPPEGADELVPAKVLADRLLAHAAVGPSTGEPIANFSEVAVLTPRGRFSVELHGSSMRLVGQAADYKIQYSSIVRLFILPRPGNQHNLAVVTLDPPIRKGQTHYPHIVMQFPADQEVEMEPEIPEELADKYAGRLEAKYVGAEADVFAKVLKALAGTKVSRHGQFRTSNMEDAAVRCVNRSDDGHLYCLEKAFFFLPKPPVLIRHDEIAEIDFERQSGAAASRTFDLVIKLTNDTVYKFSNLQRAEFQNLVNFFKAKGLMVAQLDLPPPSKGLLDQLSDSEEAHMPRGGGGGDDFLSSDEEDEDFKGGGSDDGGSPTEGSDSESGSGADSGGEGGEGGERKKSKKEKKEKAEKSSTPKKRKEKAEPAEGGKKKRAKKDKNAPKGALSAFMYFSQSERKTVLEENPGMAFGAVGKALGDRWKALTAEDKVQYEAKAKEDKERYLREKKAYEATKGAAAAEEEEPNASDSEPLAMSI